MKISKSTFVIALITILLIAITAWATQRAAYQNETKTPLNKEVISALQSGNANELSSLFSNTISFYTPEGSSTGNPQEASDQLKTFLQDHPVEGFANKQIMPDELTGVSYLQGTLLTQDQKYNLYATIYNHQIEHLDIGGKED